MSNFGQYKPDGWGSKARIGLITPHMDIVPEGEFHALAPEGVSIHAGRVPLGWRGGTNPPLLGLDAVRAFADPPYVDDAVTMLAAAPLNSIAYGFTSSSYLIGPDGDLELKNRLQDKTGGVPVVIPCQSVVEAMHILGLEKLALINPPWFPDELSALGADYFEKAGMVVTAAVSAKGLATDQLSVTPEKLFEWVRKNVPDSAECVFLGGGGLRAIGVIDALENELFRPVLSANQVAFWHALRLAGQREKISGYGRIFNH